MELEIFEEFFGQIEVSQYVPVHLVEWGIKNAQPYFIKGKSMEALCQQKAGNHYSIWLNRYLVRGKTFLTASGNMPGLELRIAIKNTLKGKWFGQRCGSLPQNCFSLGFTPHIETIAHFDDSKNFIKPVEYMSLDIYFELDYLENLGIDFKLLDGFITALHKNQAIDLSFPQRCPDEMMDAAQSIIRDHYTDNVRQKMDESLVEVILLSALDTIHQFTIGKISSVALGNEHKLKQALERIVDNFPKWQLLNDLRKDIGINIFDLGRGFKELFGLPPYQFYKEMKLREVKYALVTQGETVKDAAYTVGYDHPASLTRAFKNAYQIPPSHLKQAKR